MQTVHFLEEIPLPRVDTSWHFTRGRETSANEPVATGVPPEADSLGAERRPWEPPHPHPEWHRPDSGRA